MMDLILACVIVKRLALFELFYLIRIYLALFSQAKCPLHSEFLRKSM